MDAGNEILSFEARLTEERLYAHYAAQELSRPLPGSLPTAQSIGCCSEVPAQSPLQAPEGGGCYSSQKWQERRNIRMETTTDGAGERAFKAYLVIQMAMSVNNI